MAYLYKLIPRYKKVKGLSTNKKLLKLQKEIQECRQCADLFNFEPNPIVVGNSNSKIMQISQAPSKTVHQTGKPFNDASGKRLREEWYHISDEVFYNPANFYIVSVAHCYPGKNINGGDRRPPLDCAKQWLTQIMPLVNNDIYILIGRIAVDFLLPKRKFSELVFQDNELNGKPAFVLPHPSPLNVKWFMDNPDFLKYRIKDIENAVHKVLII